MRNRVTIAGTATSNMVMTARGSRSLRMLGPPFESHCSPAERCGGAVRRGPPPQADSPAPLDRERSQGGCRSAPDEARDQFHVRMTRSYTAHRGANPRPRASTGSEECVRFTKPGQGQPAADPKTMVRRSFPGRGWPSDMSPPACGPSARSTGLSPRTRRSARIAGPIGNRIKVANAAITTAPTRTTTHAVSQMVTNTNIAPGIISAPQVRSGAVRPSTDEPPRGGRVTRAGPSGY